MQRVLIRLAVLTLVAATAIWPGATSTVAADPPSVTDVSIDPTSLPAQGGTVTVAADVTSTVGVTAVWAEFTGWSSGPVADMPPTSGSRYSGSTQLPANDSTEPVSWSVVIRALDADGGETTEWIGEVQQDGQPQFDEIPIVWDAAAEPRQLPRQGGQVTIRAKAWDLRGISEILATVAWPGGSTTVPMTGDDAADRFIGTFDAPANPTNRPITYTIEVTAYDDIGQPGFGDAGSVTVAGIPRRPGMLRVLPRAIWFGKVGVGATREVTFVVHNWRPRSKAVAGVIHLTGTGFQLEDGSSTSVSFRLRPGQSRSFVVRFTPSTVGRSKGRLTFERADGHQPRLGVKLWGRGAN